MSYTSVPAPGRILHYVEYGKCVPFLAVENEPIDSPQTSTKGYYKVSGHVFNATIGFESDVPYHEQHLGTEEKTWHWPEQVM